MNIFSYTLTGIRRSFLYIHENHSQPEISQLHLQQFGEPDQYLLITNLSNIQQGWNTPDFNNFKINMQSRQVNPNSCVSFKNDTHQYSFEFHSPNYCLRFIDSLKLIQNCPPINLDQLYQEIEHKINELGQLINQVEIIEQHELGQLINQVEIIEQHQT